MMYLSEYLMRSNPFSSEGNNAVKVSAHVPGYGFSVGVFNYLS